MNFSTPLVNILRKCLPILTAAVLSIFMTGCFDIEEEVTLNRDGSGRYQVSMDMSEIGDMIASFAEEEGMGSSEDMFGTMDSALQAQSETLKQIEGISKVAYSIEGYTFTSSFQFEDVLALNEALAQSNSDPNNQFMQLTQGAKFSWKAGTFEKINPPIKDAMDQVGMGGDEANEEGMEMAKMMLGSASYTTIIHLPNKVKKVSNAKSDIQPDGRTVKTEISFADLMTGEATAGTIIKYKK